MIEIRREDFSIDEIVQKMRSPRIGAMLTYLGTVREFSDGVGLKFENDRNAIASQRLKEIRAKALARFDIEDVAIIHRVGFLPVSENILLIAISAAHREPAFEACRSIIDDIKDFHKSWKGEVQK